MNHPAPCTPSQTDLQQILSQCGLSTGDPVITALSGGRTSQVFKIQAEALAAVALKISTPDRQNPLFPNDPALEWRLLCHLTPAGLAPAPLARLPLGGGQTALLYQFHEGRAGATSAAELGAVLRRVHTRTPPAGLAHSPMTPDALLAHAKRILASSPAAPRWMVNLRPAAPDRWNFPQAPGLLHRDPIAPNVVSPPDGAPLLIDWQCPGIGDPCEDFAHATSPAMARVYDQTGALTSAEDLADTQDTRDRLSKLLPFLRWRMMCYCHWQVCQGQDIYGDAMAAEAEALEQSQNKAHDRHTASPRNKP